MRASRILALVAAALVCAACTPLEVAGDLAVGAAEVTVGAIDLVI